MLPPVPTWEGLHPLVIHFPIALLVSAPLFLVAGLVPWRHARSFATSALAMVALGTAGMWLAATTGEAAGDALAKTPAIAAAVERHEDAAETARAFFSALTLIMAALILLPPLLRRELDRRIHLPVHAIFIVLYVAGTLTLVDAAHQGGRISHPLSIGALASSAEAVPPAASTAVYRQASTRDGDD